MLKAGLDPNLESKYKEIGLAAILVNINLCAEKGDTLMLMLLDYTAKRDYTA